MLFAYRYKSHQMEMMHEFIEFIFEQVWCNAPNTEYGLELFEECKPLKRIMDQLYREDLAGKLKDGSGKWFYESVNQIFNEFKKLNVNNIDEYRQYFLANNAIESLCLGSSEHNFVRYSDFDPNMTALNSKLEDFFKKLYSSGFLNLEVVKRNISSNLNIYYDEFVRLNSMGYCPFCGLQPLDNEFDPTRDAFDHYLPKSKYPFNSVNLRNLVPSCNKCNSGNKRDKDPLHDSNNNRRRSFYPFSESISNIEIRVNVLEKNWLHLKPNDLAISFTSELCQEEVETWKELFKVEERYLARCCDAAGGREWLNRVFIERENYELSLEKMLAGELRCAENKPWIDANFLKKAFLEGCQLAGLFDA